MVRTVLSGVAVVAGLVLSACSNGASEPDPDGEESTSGLPAAIEPGEHVAVTGIAPDDAGASVATIVVCQPDQIVGVALLNVTESTYLEEVDFEVPLTTGVHDIGLDTSLLMPDAEFNVMTAGPDDGAAMGQTFTVEEFAELSAGEVLIANSVMRRENLPHLC